MTGEKNTAQDAAVPSFRDMLEFDEIRHENGCTSAMCAYEDGCECFREFIGRRSGPKPGES